MGAKLDFLLRDRDMSMGLAERPGRDGATAKCHCVKGVEQL